MTELKTCSRCRKRPASTAQAAYCKSCRAEYQREWRRRRLEKSEVACETATPEAPEAPRLRLRGTPTRAEMVRYRLL